MNLRISEGRKDILRPTPYKIWYQCLKDTPYENLVGPLKFCQILHDKQAIELFYANEPKQENLRCIVKDLSDWQRLLASSL